MSHAPTGPADPRGAGLHAALLRGEADAPARLFEDHYQAVIRSLGRRYRPAAASGLVEDAAAQAFASYAQRPTQYDPARRGLRGFLEMAAEGDLRNLLDGEKRHKAGSIDDVALAALPRNNSVDDAVETMMAAERIAELEGKLAALVRDPAERRVLDLMREGVRETGPYAAALGVDQLSELDQRRHVKQVKDRLKKRVSRSGVLGEAGGA